MVVQKNGKYILRKDGARLISLQSKTAKALAAAVSSIEEKENLEMIFHSADRMVIMHLPRFCLSFTLTEGQSCIRSKDYAGMHIDESQRIGALVGLRPKLVLRQEAVPQPCEPRRIVLIPRIPRGQLSVKKVMSQNQSENQNHIIVIAKQTSSRLKHDAFTIDSKLGRLVSSGTLSNTLWLCRLHALTSHCLPDPLTGMTGTEEALRILTSASVRSFQRLDKESGYQLYEIARLSPHRVYYRKTTHMEQSKCIFSALPMLSHHEGFRLAVDAILKHANDCELLREIGTTAVDMPRLAASSDILVRRAEIRNATFRVPGFGAEEHTIVHDVEYQGGQRNHDQSRSVRTLARCVVTNCQQIITPPSDRLRAAILKAAGEAFSGHPQVEITSDLGKLLSAPRTSPVTGMWCGLHTALTGEPNRYKLEFFLPALLHFGHAEWEVVQVLMALANAPGRFANITPPADTDRFDLSFKRSSLREKVEGIVKCHHKSQVPPEGTRRQSRIVWKNRCNRATDAFVEQLEAPGWGSWGEEDAPPQGEEFERCLDVDAIMSDLRDAVQFARAAGVFMTYIDKLVPEVRRMDALINPDEDMPGQEPPNVYPGPAQDRPPPNPAFVDSRSLFSHDAPVIPRPRPETFTGGDAAMEDVNDHNAVTEGVSGQNTLTDLLDRLSHLSGDKRMYEETYVGELRLHSRDIRNRPHHQLTGDPDGRARVLRRELIRCRARVEEIRGAIQTALGSGGGSIADRICQATEMYPRITPLFLLEHLTRGFWEDLNLDWKECLVSYGLSLAYLQRMERIVSAGESDLLTEVRSIGSHGDAEGDPMRHPESLLLEIEQGILIRPVQREIAAKMRDPPEGQSSVMQLNMGEGKSSVIVPMVAAALADGDCLVRVVVAKPQLKQMMHSLILTLGGLLNRRVFYLPISRAVRLDEDGLKAVKNLIKVCQRDGGVLLVQPEHLLSFKLKALEHVWATARGEAGGDRDILEAYQEFEEVSRDIVDESDENFNAKFEQIYSMGSQRPIDMSPGRWQIIQNTMDIVRKAATDLVSMGERGVSDGLLVEEVDKRRFPTIRVLKERAGRHLISPVANHICCTGQGNTGLKGLLLHHQPENMRRAVRDYILEPDLSQGQIDLVENANSAFFKEQATKNALLLLRGLLANGVILFALGQKRFRVNYGVTPDRPTMLAVPYRAKDSPAPRAEFSHPDAIIILTCLSYYYKGLSDDELRTCFHKVRKTDQADQEYSTWIASLDPGTATPWESVNLEDKTICEKIFDDVRYSKPAIDFFLANIVFPNEMRESPSKLSASGWDLAKAKQYRPLTGFSGTTDSKCLLPLSITALDLPDQMHTNSTVLACILDNKNTVLELGGNQAPSALTVDMLLPAVTGSAQPMRVILDVGAQIIELSNQEVALRWLGMVPEGDAAAVVFFDDDELSVLTRNGMVDPFLTSPFATQLERCLVFLDQAHTRGTDLKLPEDYRAAVTLGPGVTKDTLVQGMCPL